MYSNKTKYDYCFDCSDRKECISSDLPLCFDAIDEDIEFDNSDDLWEPDWCLL